MDNNIEEILVGTYRRMVSRMKRMGLRPGNEEIRISKELKASLFPDINSITVDGFTLPIMVCDWIATHDIYIVVTKHFKQNLKAMGIKARLAHYLRGLLGGIIMTRTHPSKIRKVRLDAYVENNGTGKRKVRPIRKPVAPVTIVTKKKK